MRCVDWALLMAAVWGFAAVVADGEPAAPLSGSMIEDRAAAKLLDAGQARYEA